MDGIKNEDNVMENVMEKIVTERVMNKMLEHDMCTCDSCKMDVIAYTLNHICPKYAVTNKGKLYIKLQAHLGEYSQQIDNAITTACKIVKENKRHRQ